MLDERDAAAVRQAQVLLSEHLGDGPGGDAAHVQEQHPVEVLGHGLEVVVDDHERLPGRAQRLQELHDGPLRRRVDALEGLVHEVHVGVLDERAREEDALLLPAGELRDLAARVIGHADLPERAHRGLALGGAGPLEPAEAAVEPHHHHVQHARREVPVDGAALRDVGHALPLLLVRAAVDERLPGRGVDEPEHGLDERRLARAVRPHDGHEHALRHHEVDVPQHRLVAVGHGEVVHGDGRRGSGRSGHQSAGASASTMVSMLARIMAG